MTQNTTNQANPGAGLTLMLAVAGGPLQRTLQSVILGPTQEDTTGGQLAIFDCFGWEG